MREPQRAQEMTLEQWVERLPVCHSARKEYAKLLAASLPVERGADERDSHQCVIQKAKIFAARWFEPNFVVSVCGPMASFAQEYAAELRAELATYRTAPAESRGAAQPDLEAIALKYFPASYQGTARQFCLAAMREALQLPSSSL